MKPRGTSVAGVSIPQDLDFLRKMELYKFRILLDQMNPNKRLGKNLENLFSMETSANLLGF